MHRPRDRATWVGWLLSALLLAACTPPATPPSAGPSVESAAPVDAPGPLPSEAKPLRPPVPDFLAQPDAPEGLRRISFAAGDAVHEPGVYFLNAETGKGEAWIKPGARWLGAQVSDDNRFVTLGWGGKNYLVDRQSGSIHGWDDRVSLLIADRTGFMFAEQIPGDGRMMETGRYFWTGPDFRMARATDLGKGGIWGSVALLSPDGKRIALLRRDPGSDPQPLTLIDLASGAETHLQPPAPAYVTSVGLTRRQDGFQVEVLTPYGGYPSATGYRSLVRRFDWDGTALADLELPGLFHAFSPSGKWVAWEEWPAGDVAPATIVEDLGTAEPLLVALGITLCFQATGSGGSRWLADNSGLMLSVDGGYRLLTRDGQLQVPSAFAGLTWKGEPQPAPDRTDRFAIGRTTVLTGSQSLGISLQEYVAPDSLSPWGNNSLEMRLVLPPPARGGACTEHPPMPAKVYRAGTVPELPLQVRKDGPCLRLLDRPGALGFETACLPPGTRMAARRERPDISAALWLSSAWWLRVGTERGETGWVPMAEGGITWAD